MNSSLLHRRDLKTLSKEEILKYIADMDLEKSNKLPSEDQFSTMIGVSRVTLRAALNELASDGVIFRRQGRGTFVNVIAQGMKASFNPVMDFYDMIKNNGYAPAIVLLGYQITPAPKEIADLLQIPASSQIVISKKIFYADGKFCAYCIDHFNKDLVSPEDILLLENYKGSIFQFIFEKSGRQVCWDKVEIETTDNIRTSELNQYIHLSEGMTHPFLCLKGIDYDNMDEPLVHSMEYVDTDIIKYNLIRRRTIHYITK